MTTQRAGLREARTVAGRGLIDWATGHPTFGPIARNLRNSVLAIEDEAIALAIPDEPVAGLDVERLARAFAAAFPRGAADPHETARLVAAEYARLSGREP